MVFHSFTFLYLCLIPTIILTLLVEKTKWKEKLKIQNVILLCFSFLFFSWSGVNHLFILIGLILGNYIIGILGEKIKRVLILGVILNIGVLFYFKYINLLIETLDYIIHRELELFDILPPLGISFIIFQCISYLLDVYFGKAKSCHDLLSFSLYIAFFPKLSQGPIVKYRDMFPQNQKREIIYYNFVQGCERFIIGLSKKVLIADVLATTVSDIFSHLEGGMDVGTAWLGVLCFSMQLYMDFSGYSDMAIGMANMFGFSFDENFNFPYMSCSISEFWRRWHISLGSWFREYLYIPLGGSREGNVYLHLFIVFLVTGVWHGAAWAYILWGVLHGICIVIERYCMKKEWYIKIPSILKWAVTFLIVSIGWLAFQIPSVSSILQYLKYMIGIGTGTSAFSVVYYLTPKLIAVLVITGIGIVTLGQEAVWRKFIELNTTSRIFNIIKYVILFILFYLCFLTIVSVNYVPFLYFQF